MVMWAFTALAMLGAFQKINGVYAICMAMSGSGVTIDMANWKEALIQWEPRVEG
jgi:hypothetical protein